MGLLKGFLKTNKVNFFEQIVNEIAIEEKANVLLKSPFLEGRQLVILWKSN